jgi:hypothetical protein
MQQAQNMCSQMDKGDNRCKLTKLAEQPMGSMGNRVVYGEGKINENVNPIKRNVNLILKDYLQQALELVSSDPDTGGDYNFDENYTINDFDTETIEQAKKDINWFMVNGKELIKKGELDEWGIAFGMITSRNTPSIEFWNVFTPQETEEDYALATNLLNLAMKLGYIQIIKTDEGKLRIVKK